VKNRNVTFIFFLLVCVLINAFICDDKPPQGHPGGPGLKEVSEKSKNCEFFYFFCFDFKSPNRKWRRKWTERQINVTKWLKNVYRYYSRHPGGHFKLFRSILALKLTELLSFKDVKSFLVKIGNSFSRRPKNIEEFL
jgi:hypothetical protein